MFSPKRRFGVFVRHDHCMLCRRVRLARASFPIRACGPPTRRRPSPITVAADRRPPPPRLQGGREEELPESVLGAVRIDLIDLSTATYLDLPPDTATATTNAPSSLEF